MNNNTTEHTHTDEHIARQERRGMIERGVEVSLLAFDPSRNVYAFDAITHPEGTLAMTSTSADLPEIDSNHEPAWSDEMLDRIEHEAVEREARAERESEANACPIEKCQGWCGLDADGRTCAQIAAAPIDPTLPEYRVVSQEYGARQQFTRYFILDRAGRMVTERATPLVFSTPADAERTVTGLLDVAVGTDSESFEVDVWEDNHPIGTRRRFSTEEEAQAWSKDQARRGMKRATPGIEGCAYVLHNGQPAGGWGWDSESFDTIEWG